MKRLLEHYGHAVATYQGEGHLDFGDGKRYGCLFSAGQLPAGPIVLLCHFGLKEHNKCVAHMHLGLPSPAPPQLWGTTTEGFRVHGLGLRGCDYLPLQPASEDTCGDAFTLQKMTVELATSGEPRIMHFGLTNVNPSLGGGGKDLLLPSDLFGDSDIESVALRKLPDSRRLYGRAKTLRTTEVTAEIVIEARGSVNGEPQRIADALCALLSIASGTRVQWIYCCQTDAEGIPLTRAHFDHITRPYSPLVLIGEEGLADFICQTYRAYCSKREPWKLDRGTINAYLEGKAEGDLLQSRGVKLAVGTEELKHVMLNQPSPVSKEYVIDMQQFEDLTPHLLEAGTEILEKAGVSKEDTRRVMQKDKLKMLNRVSFVSLLKNLAKEIDLPVERGELRLFTASRDSLIHQGCFYCQSAAQGPIEGLKIRQPSDEYCFMLSFLDRLLLRLLDYRGSYHDWYLREEQSVCERRPLKPSSSGQC